MNATQFSDALGKVNDKYIMEAITYKRKKKIGRLKWRAVAACFGLILTAAMVTLPGILEGPGSVVPLPAPDPEPVVSGDSEPYNTDLPQSADEHNVIINWDNVVVNESEGMALDAALLYRDPDLYAEETWGKEEIVAYYGWDLTPVYIPEGLSADSRNVSAGIWREKATGEIVADQAGRGFWPDFWEDGSPKSDDDVVIPTGFAITASKRGILHCALLPVDESKTTSFGGVPVTLSHSSLPYGPFDPTQKSPDGLHNMPAGYYDIYVASFTLDGVEYEIEARRLELEEVIKIVASVINVSSSESFTVGNNTTVHDIPNRDSESAEYPGTDIISGFDLDEPGEPVTP